MKTMKIFAAAAVVAAIAFTSCAKENDTTPDNDPVEVKFAGDIGQIAVANTRVTGNSWDANNSIGIFMVGNGETTIVDGASNKIYTTSLGGETGSFAPAADNAIFYPASGAVDFIAYYPHTADYTLAADVLISVPANQTGSAQAGADLLWAKANNNESGYTKAYSSAVGLVFDHKLARLEMNILAGEGVGSLSNLAIAIKGTKPSRKFSLASGTFTDAAEGTEADITPRLITANAKYDAFLIPTSYAADVMTVTFTNGSDVYTWTVGEKGFESGKEYSYNITLGKNGVTVSGTINDWGSGTGGSVNATN